MPGVDRSTAAAIPDLDRWRKGDAALPPGCADEITLANPRVPLPTFAWNSSDRDGIRYAVASIKTIDASHPEWLNPVLVTVRDRKGAIDIVGIERPSQVADVR